MRIRRTSLAATMLGLAGFYPWCCESCGHHFTLRRRGKLSSRESDKLRDLRDSD